MSFKATNWANEVRGLKAGAFRVLMKLANRHNPDLGCFPGQERLADDSEMSRSALNENLKALEAMNLIKRVRRWDPVTYKQMSTRYWLGFEDGFDEIEGDADVKKRGKSRVRKVDTDPKAVSGKCQKPCPENGDSRVRNPDTNLVIETVIEPSEDFSDNLKNGEKVERFKTPEDRKAFHQAVEKVAFRWARDRAVGRIEAYLIDRIPHDIDGDEADAFVFNRQGPAWNAAIGQLGWAVNVATGADDNHPPTGMVGLNQLIKEMGHKICGAGIIRRCQALVAHHKARVAAAQEQQDSQQTDEEGEAA